MQFLLNQARQSRCRYLIQLDDGRMLEVPSSRVDVFVQTTGESPDARGVLPAEISAYRVWRKDGTYLDVEPADMLVVKH